MKKFPLNKIKGASPHEIGFQYGVQAKDMIEACIQDYKVHFKSLASVSWEEIKKNHYST